MYINVESYPSHSNTEDTLGKKLSDCILFPALHCPLVVSCLCLRLPVLLSLSGCSYDKQMRSFTDDVCVVPEKFEGWRKNDSQFGCKIGLSSIFASHLITVYIVHYTLFLQVC